MRRSILILATAAAMAVAPAAASAQSTGQTIPVPDPILTKLGHTPMVELWDGGGGLPYLGSAGPYNAGDWEAALDLYQSSGVYMQQLAKVDAVAAQWLRRAQGFKKFKAKKRWFHHSAHKAMIALGRGHKHHGHHGHKHHGHHGNNKKRAVVFDIDETSLSNFTAIKADRYTFGPQSQAEAVNEIGTAIVPTRDIFNLAKQKGYATFLITGRREDVRDHTASNLAREGFSGYTGLILRPVGAGGSVVDYKSGERAKIEDQGYKIVANVGDQYSDLAGGHSQVVFKLPNPFYFLP
jgi:predicted secreted acid phosphatase